MTTRRRVILGCCAACLVALLGGAAVVAYVRKRLTDKEWLQSRRGVEYIVAMARLRLRDPIRDARHDLRDGNRDLYCVGTFTCLPVGVDGAVPDGFSFHATAATGCVITDGALEMAYRNVGERYVAAYNKAKLAAYRSGWTSH